MTVRCLLVDDEPSILRALARCLRRAGYEVITASDADEALAILEEDDVDVILSDQRMPGLLGTELLARVRRRHPDVVRLMLTGESSLTAAQDAINHGKVHRFLTKGSRPEDILAEIARALAETPSETARRRRRRLLREQPSLGETPDDDVVRIDPLWAARMIDALRSTLTQPAAQRPAVTPRADEEQG